MKTGSILTKAQAEAVYSAMCALNSVSHGDGFRISFHSTIDGCVERINVEETDVDMIRVSYHDGRITHCEHHEGQSAFAAAYGLGKQEQAG